MTSGVQWGSAKRRVGPIAETPSPTEYGMGISDRFRDPLSKDEFGQTIADRIREAGEPGRVSYDSEDFHIVIEDDSEEVLSQYNLENVYREYCDRPATERDGFLTRIVQVGLVRHKAIPEDFADAKTDILPAIRSRATFELTWLEHQVKGQEVGPDLPFLCVGDHLMGNERSLFRDGSLDF